MQLRTIHTLAATVAVAMISTTDASVGVPEKTNSMQPVMAPASVPARRALGEHQLQMPLKTNPMQPLNRKLGDHEPQVPMKTNPMQPLHRTLGEHEPQVPMKTNPMQPVQPTATAPVRRLR